MLSLLQKKKSKMSITVKQGISGKYFSSNIPDVEVAITGYRLGVKMETSTDGSTWKEIYSEHLFPIDSLVRLADLGSLLTPYARRSLVLKLRMTMIEDFADGSASTQETQSCDIVYCEADIPTGCEDFTTSHFLSLLLGVKTTAVGRLEYLHYIGTEKAAVKAYYSDGTTADYEPTVIGGNGSYTTIDVSPGGYTMEGRTLTGYVVMAGQRRQEYEIDLRRPDCAPVLLFLNSFGCEELLYCTGTETKSPSFKRTTAYIDGKQQNYSIVETRTFKADTGIMNEDMAGWFGEVLRSSYVRIVTFLHGHPNIGREVIITESKSDQTNDDDELPRFTFSYTYAQRNHNIVEMKREGRIFDNTFDYTFN